MVIDAQYTRNRDVCSMVLCDPPRLHLSSPAFPPRLPASFTRSTRHYRTGCCTLPFAAAGNIALSHALLRSVSLQRADARRRIDRSSWLDRRDTFAESAGSIVRIISKLMHTLVPPAFASCGQTKEYGKVIKSATRCAIVEELISKNAQDYASHKNWLRLRIKEIRT